MSNNHTNQGDAIMDITTKTQEPAFPHDADAIHLMRAGMSLRDYFAAAALTGMLSDRETANTVSPQDTAEWAYQCADAMLLERELS